MGTRTRQCEPFVFGLSHGTKLFFPITMDDDVYMCIHNGRGQNGKFCPTLNLSGNGDGNRKSPNRIECYCF